jgi:hypothetical protein
MTAFGRLRSFANGGNTTFEFKLRRYWADVELGKWHQYLLLFFDAAPRLDIQSVK